MRASLVSRPWAGLDVGTFSVKLLALQPGMGSVRVLAGETPLAEARATSNGEPNPEGVARAIARCAEQAGVSLRSLGGITMGISGADVIVKQIALPLMDDAEVGQALRFEARKHLPFDPQAMVIDYQVLGRYVSERKVEVLLAAVPREHLERHVAPLALLDVSVDIVDAAPLALTNALVQAEAGERGPHVLLDVGEAGSYLTLYQRGEPYFSRRMDFGGRSLTRAVAEKCRIPVEEAEEWKLAAGSGNPPFRVDWEGPEMRAILERLQSDLVDEIRRSLAFYRTLGRLPEPLKLRLSGSSARLPGIAERLGDLLGAPVSVFDPLDGLGGGRGGVAGGPQFAQAFGLCLRHP